MTDKKIPTEQELYDGIKEIVTADYEGMKGREKCCLCNEYKDITLTNVYELELNLFATTKVCHKCLENVEYAIDKSLKAWARAIIEDKNLPFLAAAKYIIEDSESFTESIRDMVQERINGVMFERDVKGDKDD